MRLVRLSLLVCLLAGLGLSACRSSLAPPQVATAVAEYNTEVAPDSSQASTQGADDTEGQGSSD